MSNCERLIREAVSELECFERGLFPCDENHMALACLGQALECLAARTKDRKERGVEGCQKA